MSGIIAVFAASLVAFHFSNVSAQTPASAP